MQSKMKRHMPSSTMGAGLNCGPGSQLNGNVTIVFRNYGVNRTAAGCKDLRILSMGKWKPWQPMMHLSALSTDNASLGNESCTSNRMSPRTLPGGGNGEKEFGVDRQMTTPTSNIDSTATTSTSGRCVAATPLPPMQPATPLVELAP